MRNSNMSVKWHIKKGLLHSYIFSKPHMQIYFNGELVEPGLNQDGILIAMRGIQMIAEIPEIGAIVTFNGYVFSIQLPYSKFGNNTEGQCGKDLLTPLFPTSSVFVHQLFRIITDRNLSKGSKLKLGNLSELVTDIPFVQRYGLRSYILEWPKLLFWF